MTSKYVDMMIEKYGEELSISCSDMAEQSTKAFIQPLRKKGNSYYGNEGSDLGIIDESNYLYIGKKDVRLDLYPFDTILQTNEDKYILKKAHKVCIGPEIIYIWGIVQKHNGEDD